MYRKEWKGMEKKVPPSNSPSMGRIREDFFITDYTLYILHPILFFYLYFSKSTQEFAGKP